MKIKFSRIMAIGCALSVAFAGLTAFADATVITKTSYDLDEDVTNITVETTVSEVPINSEVTYYVSKADGEIVYINQGTAVSTVADATTGSVSFTFTDTKADVLLTTARYGSDATGLNLPTFDFQIGCNYLTNGAANVAIDDTNWGANLSYTEGSEIKSGTAYKATVSGSYTEYGIMIGEEKYPAAGCAQDGTYLVILEGITAEKANVMAYAVKLDGTTVVTDTYTAAE